MGGDNDRVFESKTDDDNDDDDDDNMDITPEQSPIDDIDGDLEELITALTDDINMIDNDDGIGHLPLLQSLSDKKRNRVQKEDKKCVKNKKNKLSINHQK